MPWVCRACHLVNWPRFKDGLPRLSCFKCGVTH
jgi:ribosomal protein S27AE